MILREKRSEWLGLVLLLVMLALPRLVWANGNSGPQIFAAGQLALSQGKYAKALKLLRRALKLLPHWGHVHLEYARALRYNSGSPKLIAAALQKAQRLLPQTNPRVPLFAGLFWEGQGEREKAAKYYSLAMKLGHSDPRACLRASRIWLSMQQGAKAIPCLRRLLARRRSVGESHTLLAQALTQNKEIKEASKHWILALSYQPLSLTLLQQVYLFYAQYTSTRPRNERRRWKKTFRRLERRLKRLLPKKHKRKMRMLQPSRR